VFTFHVYALSGFFFYAKSLDQSWVATRALLEFKDVGGPLSWLSVGEYPTFQLVLLIIGSVFLEVWQYIDSKETMYERLKRMPRALRWGIVYALFFGILFFGILDAYVFIYFQF
jgi:hypothetical protein